jgi:hypothetical protein
MTSHADVGGPLRSRARSERTGRHYVDWMASHERPHLKQIERMVQSARVTRVVAPRPPARWVTRDYR